MTDDGHDNNDRVQNKTKKNYDISKVGEGAVMSLLLFCLVWQLDLPLSRVFYKWLLGLESTLTLSDIHHVDPVLAASLQQLQDVVIQKKNLEADTSHVRTLLADL